MTPPKSPNLFPIAHLIQTNHIQFTLHHQHLFQFAVGVNTVNTVFVIEKSCILHLSTSPQFSYHE